MILDSLAFNIISGIVEDLQDLVIEILAATKINAINFLIRTGAPPLGEPVMPDMEILSGLLG